MPTYEVKMKSSTALIDAVAYDLDDSEEWFMFKDENGDETGRVRSGEVVSVAIVPPPKAPSIA